METLSLQVGDLHHNRIGVASSPNYAVILTAVAVTRASGGCKPYSPLHVVIPSPSLVAHCVHNCNCPEDRRLTGKSDILNSVCAPPLAGQPFSLSLGTLHHVILFCHVTDANLSLMSLNVVMKSRSSDSALPRCILDYVLVSTLGSLRREVIHLTKR
jgi:hypothetical protein